ncbi:MAG: hypothetical protein Q8P41_06685 [Pseudomonadota bacterium]|nr:hypothetical protein [Pseudomonadota bacterium]
MTERSILPETLPIDPWWDLYMPATFGEPAAVLDALEAAEAMTPLSARGDFYAVAARAFAVLGRSVEAERLAGQAFRIGGAEADALATFLCPDGIERATKRLQGGGRPGARADSGCDLAALLVQLGRVDAAGEAIDQALAVCPGHAEASRWRRFLGEADVMNQVRLARDPRRARRGPAARDAVDLLPTRRTGWLSAERYHRRVLSNQPQAAWAPAGTGLGRLQDAGVSVCFFALDHEYARTAPDHPLVALELDADALRARVEEGRDARDGAAALWAAVASDPEAQQDAAQLLVALATLDARLAAIGLEAALWLTLHQPDRGLLWEGYLAWLSHLAGLSSAVERARSLATTRPMEPLAWKMAVEVLRAEGHHDEAELYARAARVEPALSALACDLLQDPVPTPVRMVVSGRLTPRWPRAPRPPRRSRGH